jgi:hypothetical protein
MMRVIKSNIIKWLLLIVPAIVLGCSGPIIDKGYLFEPYYKSIVQVAQDQKTMQGLGRIRIDTIEFDKPYIKYDVPITIMRLFPILSAIQRAEDIQRNCFKYNYNIRNLQKGELEKILVSDLRNSGVFNKVDLDDTPWDYEIKGKVNFTIESYTHFSGFGFIAYCGMILPGFLFPVATVDTVCEAHFDVISAKDNRIILAKDYRSSDEKSIRPFYSDKTQELFPRVLGKNIYPTIVKQFIDDLADTLKSENHVFSQLR